MAVLRHALVLGLVAFATQALASDLAQAPRIGRPVPVGPNTPNGVLPLPPAEIDNALAIGGDEVKAREADTRLNVEVRLNGRGPYRFVGVSSRARVSRPAPLISGLTASMTRRAAMLSAFLPAAATAM